MVNLYCLDNSGLHSLANLENLASVSISSKAILCIGSNVKVVKSINQHSLKSLSSNLSLGTFNKSDSISLIESANATIL